MNNECIHGHLARKCEVCELIIERDALETGNRNAILRIKSLETQLWRVIEFMDSSVAQMTDEHGRNIADRWSDIGFDIEKLLKYGCAK